MSEFPIQRVKVQRPPLLTATLERDRLLDWLNVQIHHRVVLITAEAGFGKTTLLADFARRTRVRTAWYRLDEDDRNFVSFLNYIVAAGREAVPGFAPVTSSLLEELGSGGPTQDVILETFLRELPGLVESGPAAIILDDFHLVDDAPDVAEVMRAVIDRLPDRLALVISSRRRSTLPLARIRSLGEAAELETDDLRFDSSETERLFRETYGRPLEPDVLDELNRRTEGWVASLQLLQTALRSRTGSEVRAFVRNLNGAQADLYDYLAEEVVGDLDAVMQRFLMRTCILQVVNPELTALLTDYDEPESQRLMAGAERLGLLSRRGETTNDQLRYQPLVRDFLEARLRRDEGDAIVPVLHRQVGEYAESRDWALSAHHYAAADARPELQRVLANSVQIIMGRGEFALAESYIDRLEIDVPRPEFDIVRSRMELQRGYLPAAIARANAAYANLPEGEASDLKALAVANLVTVTWQAGDIETMQLLNDRLIAMDPPARLEVIARATRAIVATSLELPLSEPRGILLEAERVHRADSHHHYLGITLLNLGDLDLAADEMLSAAERAAGAIESLGATSAGLELSAAQIVRAIALVHLDRWSEGAALMAEALAIPFALVRSEVLGEVGATYGAYHDPEKADKYFREADQLLPESYVRDAITLHWARNEIRLGRYDSAERMIASLTPDIQRPVVCFQLRILIAKAELALATEQVGSTLPRMSLDLARRQGALYWAGMAQILVAATEGAAAFNSVVSTMLRNDPSQLAIEAEVVVPRLHWLDDDTFDALLARVIRRPERWRPAIRRAVIAIEGGSSRRAALILEEIGVMEDVLVLRRASRKLKTLDGRAQLGRRLARALAPRVLVEDQGRVRILVGDRPIDGTEVRRKVLALLCFLGSRIGMSATRDQVLEALWPDAGPATAMNSLNQTVYFLRRVFEPEYKDSLSPGYLHHDSEVLWLDPELIRTRSAGCRDLITRLPTNPAPDEVEAVASSYQGRFALDFAYEEWASEYRDWLHAGYLETMERAVIADTDSGHFDRAIGLARRCLGIDPDSEAVERALLHLYLRTGARAAAAEQYSHYAAIMQEITGSPAPPLDQLWSR